MVFSESLSALPALEITIPVLNEEATLEQQAKCALAVAQQSLAGTCRVCLVIADNGSTDETREIARRLSAADPDIKFICVDERGVGRALKASWDASQADLIGYMDLDLATDLKHLPEAIATLIEGRAEVVSGSRLMPGSVVRGRSLTRALTTRAFNAILKSYLRVRFTDGMCGFKFLRRDALQQIRDTGADNDGWFFATEVLVCAERLGLTVVDLPVTWTDDANSHVRLFRLSTDYLRSMRRLKRRLQLAGLFAS